MNPLRFSMPVLSIALCLVGCGFRPDPEPVFCTEVFVYGVNVTLADEAGVAVTGATVTITEDDFEETLMEMQPGMYTGAGERAGTYTLSVAADGFTPVTIADLVVDRDVCHVIPVDRNIRLSRSQ